MRTVLIFLFCYSLLNLSPGTFGISCEKCLTDYKILPLLHVLLSRMQLVLFEPFLRLLFGNDGLQ